MAVVYSHVTDEDLRKWQMSPTATTTFTIVDGANPAVDQEVALTYHLIKMKLSSCHSNSWTVLLGQV